MKRFLWILATVFATIFFLTLLAFHLEIVDYTTPSSAGEALNWLGVMITVFSLSVTFFLAVMAIEAFSHMNSLRQAANGYEELMERLSEDESSFDRIRRAMTTYNTEVMEILDRHIQHTDVPDEQKIEFSRRYQISRSRLELSSLANEERKDFDRVMTHVLVLLEKGERTDLEFALDALKHVDDPTLTYATVGVLLKKLRTK